MILYINGQDIKSFAIGFVGTELAEPLRVFTETKPEAYLGHIHEFLADSNKAISDIKQIYVVVGPGSATALRSSLSIVNTIAFVKGVKLVAVEKNPIEKDRDTLHRINFGELKTSKPTNFLKPTYAHGPRITKSNKDSLKRKIKPNNNS